MTKTCATCQRALPVTEFGARPNGKGRQCIRRHCRDCMNAAQRAMTPEQRATINARRRAARAAQRAEPIPGRLLSRAPRKREKAPLPTLDEMARWYRAGCPL